MAYSFTVKYPRSYEYDLCNIFKMLAQRVIIRYLFFFSFLSILKLIILFCVDPLGIQMVISCNLSSFLFLYSYYIYPTAIDRIETVETSRKFPIIVYDLRNIEKVQVYFIVDELS